jgi:hypothetical protein
VPGVDPEARGCRTPILPRTRLGLYAPALRWAGIAVIAAFNAYYWLYPMRNAPVHEPLEGRAQSGGPAFRNVPRNSGLMTCVKGAALIVCIAIGAAISVGVAFASLPRGVSGRGTVHCGSVVDEDPAPTPAGMRVVFDHVALAAQDALPRPHRIALRPFRYWSKSGILVRAGSTPVDLIVPPGWKKRYAIDWGDSGLTADAHVLGCAGGTVWNAYAGGFRLRAPACVPLTVRVGGKSTRLRFSVGAPCPS